MAKKSSSASDSSASNRVGHAASVDALKTPSRPLIFVSHDHRDSALAASFADLLTDVSGGFLKSFRSSDRKGGAGIEFGAEWYSEIMGKIDDATDVVALLTPNSLDRPWILFEAGVAKGKLGKPVFGIAVGIAFDQATKGPFAQFQNSADDEDSLTKLVLQLIRRNSDAEPREEAVRRQVAAFKEHVAKLTATKETKGPSAPGAVEANDAAKLFEEIKVMFRDLPERLHGQLSASLGPGSFRRRRKFHPEMMMDFFREDAGDPALAWLMTVSSFRDEAPWLYELGLDVYKALKVRDPRRISQAIDRFEKSMNSVRRSRIGHYLIESPDTVMAVHELTHILRLFVERQQLQFLPEPATKPKKPQEQQPKSPRHPSSI